MPPLRLIYLELTCRFVPIVFQTQGYKTTFNTGWSSAQNSEGDRVLSLEAALVIAHGKNTKAA